MNSQKFVQAIKLVVRDAAVEDTILTAESPPGRKVPVELKARAEWLKSLPIEQKDFVHSLVKDAVDNAVFGFFCVIDGVRAIEDDPDKGDIELRYVKDDVAILSPTEGAMLHDIYNSQP